MAVTAAAEIASPTALTPEPLRLLAEPWLRLHEAWEVKETGNPDVSAEQQDPYQKDPCTTLVICNLLATPIETLTNLVTETYWTPTLTRSPAHACITLYNLLKTYRLVIRAHKMLRT